MKKLLWKDSSNLATSRRTCLLSAFVIGVVLFAEGVLPARAEDRVQLENGLIRVSFNNSNGLFDVEDLSGQALLLHNASPSFQVDGRTISSSDLERVATKRESFEDQLGHGEKLVARYFFRDRAPSFRYELSLYSGKPWVSITAFLPRGDYALGDFNLLKANLHVPEAFKSRVYVNSGEAGGASGTWNLGMRRWESANLSAWYDPKTQGTVQVGFYSFYRARTSVAARSPAYAGGLGGCRSGVRSSAVQPRYTDRLF
jgi:hypothetical protein